MKPPVSAAVSSQFSPDFLKNATEVEVGVVKERPSTLHRLLIQTVLFLKFTITHNTMYTWFCKLTVNYINTDISRDGCSLMHK